jgi:RNA polymerase sigma factor (sigma-70 family)
MSGDTTYQMMDHLFRHEAGKMVSLLTHRFGLAQLQLAEDAVQDAFVLARNAWKIQIPDNPSGWLWNAARNRAIDSLRRCGKWKEIANQLGVKDDYELLPVYHEGELADNQLQLIFACCHPALKSEDQLALTLKTVSGFSPAEIGRALLRTEESVQKRLERARDFLRGGTVVLEIPAGADLPPRIEAVCRVLYLLFNEGYNSGKPNEPIRYDLCAEALRCGRLLTEHPRTSVPTASALLALMCFHAARFESRLDTMGRLVRLHEQNRASWDRELIAVGTHYLDAASTGHQFSRYHIEAAIAALHCLAPSFAETNWERLLLLYDALVRVDPSPLVHLNRAVVVAEIDGAAAAIEVILQLPGIEGLLRTHYLFPAVLGEMYGRLSAGLKARDLLQQAQGLTSSGAEKALLQQKIDLLGN